MQKNNNCAENNIYKCVKMVVTESNNYPEVVFNCTHSDTYVFLIRNLCLRFMKLWRLLLGTQTSARIYHA